MLTLNVSLHDALPIFVLPQILGRYDHVEHGIASHHARADPRAKPQPDHSHRQARGLRAVGERAEQAQALEDRKSTRLNSSHLGNSYAVFCSKKKSSKR